MKYGKNAWIALGVPLLFLTGCGETTPSAAHELERERVLGKISFGMPFEEVRSVIFEETGISKWNGFWDVPNEESGRHILTDCRYVGVCAVEPDLNIGKATEAIDWGRFIVISAYHEPPRLGRPGAFMYLIFDSRTRLLVAKVFWPKV
jgi:hypothetical protein